MHHEPWDTEGLLKLSGSYWMTCALHAGVKLDIFSHLENGPFTPEEVAAKIQGDSRAVGMLLNALSAMRLVQREGGGYANTDAAGELLVKNAPGYIGHMIKHHHFLMPSWSQLDRSVLSGKPNREGSTFGDDEKRESFLMGMFTLASGIAPGLAESLDLSGRRHLLDLGGGPGTYAIHFCRQNPDLRATVYDLPTTRPFAEKTIERFGMASRIDFMEGDYLMDIIEGSFDVIWMSQVLHAEGAGDCLRLLNKAVSAAAADALVLIHEFILDDTKDSPLFPALFSLNMLLGTAHGQSYSEGRIREFMEGAGLTDIERLPFTGPNDSAIMAGRVPS